MPPLTRFQLGAIETGHIHTNDQIIDTETSESWEPAGGPGGASDLEAVLTEGNTTGENTIVMPMGVLHGTTDFGDLELIAGDGVTFNGGFVVLAPSDGEGTAGNARLRGGNDEFGGEASLYGGNGGVTFGARVIAGGASDGGPGAPAQIIAGEAGGTDQNGGDIDMTAGAGNGTGRNGLVFLHLPTADPNVAGALWADSGVVKVSAG